MAFYVKWCQNEDELRTNDEWRYMVRGDGSYISIIDYLGNEAEVDMPSELDGLPVREIFFKGDRYSPYTGGLSGFKGIRKLTLPDTLTNIGDMAFSGCRSLESIQIPDSVRLMSEWVFAECCSLTEIRFPKSMKEIPYGVMLLCKNLKRVYIPDTVTKISSNAFQGCESLEEVVLPAALRELGRDVFQGCRLLRKLSIAPENPLFTTEDGILYNKDRTQLLWYPAAHPGRRYEVSEKLTGTVDFHRNPFLEEIVWPGERGLMSNQFDGLTSLKQIRIPDGTKHLSDRTFRNCGSLTELELPEGLETIEHAFQGCKGLTQLVFPDSLTHLADLFTDCTGLRRVTIGPNTKLDFWFRRCPSLEEIRIHPEHPDYVVRDGVVYSRDGEILFRYPPSRAGEEFVVPDSVRIIGEGAFHDCRFLKRVVCHDGLEIKTAAFADSCALTEVVLPVDIRRIPAMAFGDCTGLKQFSFPASVEEIGEGAFEGCEALASLILPEKLVKIGEGAFRGCISLTEVTLPPMVKTYEYGVFRNCAALQTINCMGGRSKWEKRKANQKFLTDRWLPEQAQICFPRRPARKTASPGHPASSDESDL